MKEPKKQYNLKIETSLRLEATEIAEKEHTTLSAWIRHWMRKGIKEYNKLND